MALCGACTVHVNGQPMRSCSTPISSVAGKSVRTIEGLSPDGTDPVQRAWIEADVPQCGYCQSGQIMTAAALLAKKAQPTDADIDEAMRNNICWYSSRYCRRHWRSQHACRCACGGQRNLCRHRTAHPPPADPPRLIAAAAL
jgi:xanthine dehydrogenase iron-sulfur cluster and FAD-binding subunit A